MPQVVGVRFKQAGKIYYFGPGDIPDIQVDDHVIVQTSRGYEAGQVAMGPREVTDDEIVGKLKPVTRAATTGDLLSKQRYSMREAEVLERCREKVAEYRLPMKMVSAEFSFDGSSLVFFFTADKRVDFRELVRDLARTFRTRIELRQIGVRDEAKLIGGIGSCGRELCCSTHLTDFRPVSIKMAKQQDLPLSPMEISGLCGRLLCCLAYENDFYTEARRILPKRGEFVNTSHGRGRVLSSNVVKQTVQIMLDSEVTVEVPWSDSGEELIPEPVVEEVVAAAEPARAQRAPQTAAPPPSPPQPAASQDSEEQKPRRRSRRRRSRRGGRSKN